MELFKSYVTVSIGIDIMKTSRLLSCINDDSEINILKLITSTILVVKSYLTNTTNSIRLTNLRLNIKEQYFIISHT